MESSPNPKIRSLDLEPEVVRQMLEKTGITKKRLIRSVNTLRELLEQLGLLEKNGKKWTLKIEAWKIINELSQIDLPNASKEEIITTLCANTIKDLLEIVHGKTTKITHLSETIDSYRENLLSILRQEQEEDALFEKEKKQLKDTIDGLYVMLQVLMDRLKDADG